MRRKRITWAILLMGSLLVGLVSWVYNAEKADALGGTIVHVGWLSVDITFDQQATTQLSTRYGPLVGGAATGLTSAVCGSFAPAGPQAVGICIATAGSWIGYQASTFGTASADNECVRLTLVLFVPNISEVRQGSRGCPYFRATLHYERNFDGTCDLFSGPSYLGTVAC